MVLPHLSPPPDKLLTFGESPAHDELLATDELLASNKVLAPSKSPAPKLKAPGESPVPSQAPLPASHYLFQCMTLSHLITLWLYLLSNCQLLRVV